MQKKTKGTKINTLNLKVMKAKLILMMLLIAISFTSCSAYYGGGYGVRVHPVYRPAYRPIIRPIYVPIYHGGGYGGYHGGYHGGGFRGERR